MENSGCLPPVSSVIEKFTPVHICRKMVYALRDIFEVTFWDLVWRCQISASFSIYSRPKFLKKKTFWTHPRVNNLTIHNALASPISPLQRYKSTQVHDISLIQIQNLIQSSDLLKKFKIEACLFLSKSSSLALQILSWSLDIIAIISLVKEVEHAYLISRDVISQASWWEMTCPLNPSSQSSSKSLFSRVSSREFLMLSSELKDSLSSISGGRTMLNSFSGIISSSFSTLHGTRGLWQSASVIWVTSFLFSFTAENRMLFLLLNDSSHPLLAVKLLWPKSLAMVRAFCCIIGPVTGIFLQRVLLNHSRTFLLTSSYRHFIVVYLLLFLSPFSHFLVISSFLAIMLVIWCLLTLKSLVSFLIESPLA